jgi:hypothetical protein
LNLQDQYLRRAIYEIYDYKCFYTGEPLDYINMELDHIIPRSYQRDPMIIRRIIKECDLPEDFHVDSLLNLVPTSRFNNRRKSDMELISKNIVLFFSFTRLKASLIEKKITELKKNRNIEKHLSMLKTQVDEESDEKSREKLLLNIFSFITDESDEFIETDQLYYKEREQFYRKYVSKIALEALMPRYNNPQTECVIYFKTLTARDCMFVLDNKTVLSQLFKGVYSDPKHGARGFLEYGRIDENKLEYSLDLNNTKIVLGKNRVKISPEDIYLFCEVVDAYADMYIKQIKNIEELLKTDKYPLSKRLNNYKLIYISYHDWKKVIDFAYKHDVDNGNSKWHVFDKNKHYIKIFTKKHDKYDEGYHAFFQAEHSEDIVLYPSLTTKDVCITFEFVEDISRKGEIDLINERAHWNGEIAYNWLVNILLPKSLGKRKSNKVKKVDAKYKSLFTNSIEKIIYLDGKLIVDYKDLIEVVELLQIHFNQNPHNKYRVNKADFQGIYNSIITCINKLNEVDLYYLCSKLHLTKCTTNKELINSITEISAEIQDTTINGFEMDLLFRVLFSALDSGGESLTMKEIQSIRSDMNYFVIARDREVLLDKYSINFQYG